MRILVDTNVVIDALTSREPWNKSAEEIFLMAARRRVDMYITARLCYRYLLSDKEASA